MPQSLKNLVLNIFFPPACLTCEKGLVKDDKYQLVCGECFVGIPLYNSLFCSICLKRLPPVNGQMSMVKCHDEALYLLAPAANYSDPRIQKLIWQMKYKNWLTAAEPIGDLLTAYCHNLSRNLDLSKYIVVPVPLYPKRELKRGFNQAAILANVIGKRFFLPLEKNNLIRVKDTKTQTDLKDYQAREENLRGAFQITDSAALKNKNIVLVDDVFTSGATLNEAARVLNSAGAKKILALVVARAR